MRALAIPLTPQLRRTYQPAVIEAKELAGFADPAGIETVSVSTLLAVYNWTPQRGERYLNVSDFMRGFFARCRRCASKARALSGDRWMSTPPFRAGRGIPRQSRASAVGKAQAAAIGHRRADACDATASASGCGAGAGCAQAENACGGGGPGAAGGRAAARWWADHRARAQESRRRTT